MINFDKRDPRNAWMMFFTNPGAMKQIYTPEEQANLKEVFEAVDAWELLDSQEHEFPNMDDKDEKNASSIVHQHPDSAQNTHSNSTE
jgi:hypothetical protein